MTKHNHSRKGAWSPTYYSWVAMKRRCTNPGNNPRHANYMGISFDPKWKSFAVFLADMGVRPPEMTLDRIDSREGYSKQNCRWATHAQQAQNKTTNKLTPGDIERIRDLGACKVTQKVIGSYFGVSRPHIGYILRGLQWV